MMLAGGTKTLESIGMSDNSIADAVNGAAGSGPIPMIQKNTEIQHQAITRKQTTAFLNLDKERMKNILVRN
jgi:hypothetical protein